MLLSPPAITITPWNGRKILPSQWPAHCVVARVAAVAIIVHRMQRLEPSAHAQLLAKQVEEAWVANTGQPLRFVDGITNLANGVTAYAIVRAPWQACR
jgi:hypothetical protein